MRRKFEVSWLMLLSLFLFLVMKLPRVVEAAEYCALPPFLTTGVSPNILFVLDVSGSMTRRAYREIYNPDKTYEGYFDPNKKYKLVHELAFFSFPEVFWEEAGDAEENCPFDFNIGFDFDFDDLSFSFSIGNVCSGNFLNWLFMTRIDLLRWAITGGTPESCTDDFFLSFFSVDSLLDSPECDPAFSSSCNGDTCMLETYIGQKVKVPKSRIQGILQQMEKESVRPRFGALFYSDRIRPEKVYLGDYPYTGRGQPGDADPDHPYTHLIRFVNYISPLGGTGTAIAMWEAYDYFAQNNAHDYANGFDIAPGTYKDPQYFCDYQKANCQPAPCAKNFIILVSDGHWNYGGTPEGEWTCRIDSGYENYSADPVVPAYRMHHDVLRTLTTASGGSTNIRVQQVYALGLFLGSAGEIALKNVAMYGSFDLNHGDWPNGLTNYPQDTCWPVEDCPIISKGSLCTPLPPSSEDWDKDGDGVPDTFFSAQTASEIKGSLLKFLISILAKTASGTSVSVLTARGLKGSSVVQAVFYPQKYFGSQNLSWIGYLYDYWLYTSFTTSNIREDTPIQNRALDVCSPSLQEGGDYILDFKIDNHTGDLQIDAYYSACNGTATTKATTYNSLDEVHPVWEAGEKLASSNATTRIIYTSADQSSLLPSRPVSLSEFKNVANATAGLLGDEDGDRVIDDADETIKVIDNPIRATDLVNYVYGVDLAGYRSRTTDTGKVWKLGDIIYSTPQVVQYYRENTSSGKAYNVVYVGANDGMLHAFRLGQPRFDGLAANQVVKLCNNSPETCSTDELGEELWAFVPKNALPYLRYLTDPEYCHLYYVDLQPYIVQVDDNKDEIPEKVILIGGMRLGGAAGCTGTGCINPPEDTCNNPSRYSPTSNDCVGLSSYFALDVTDPERPKFLWEFADPDLGFTYSGPAVITYNGTRYVMFLSGPTSYKGDVGQDLKAFVLKLRDDFTVERVYKFPDDYGSGGDTSFFAPYNNAFGGRLFSNGIDYDKDGNTDMVVFGINQRAGGVWQGNIAGVLINSVNPAEWDFQTIFTSAIEPVTAKVEYMECFGHHFIFFGTGRWFFKDDEPGQNTQDTEKLYGVSIDDCLTGGSCMINPAHGFDDPCNDLLAANRVPAWRITLAPKDDIYFKERLITDPTTTDMNIILFTTFQPTADICGYGGRTRVWAMNCAIGGALNDTSCPGYTLESYGGTIYLQLSRGNIEEFKLSTESFTQEAGKATEWQIGVPPDGHPPFLRPFQSAVGHIIYWFER
ncbi:pilus assembly protein [Thermosulfurimonas dismutans]|uniref:Type IV fimbrial biogenesis protein PilY1 n=1 Tax=Thermosulfurimonas dismutans TaxID=999894 RepID=A0A179D3U8_9BACT|nr:hypothetical protein [Thermosulfurimonas dismutans]OAQ20716.1 Type IV fimbrial biogenesis protein PilY1 [Thermosulfurimonas dismutans]